MSLPLRVLHVFGRLDMGGAESLIMNIYRQIDKTKVQFDFVVHTQDACFFEPEIIELGGRVYHEIPRYKLYNYFTYKQAWSKFFNEHDYKVVHIHTTNSALPILLEAKNHGVSKRILHAHSTGEANALRRLNVKFTRPLLRRYSTYMLAASEPAGKFVFWSGYTVKANAVDARRFRFDTALRQNIRRHMGWEDFFIILHIGRFQSMKNHSFILKFFAQLSIKMPKARLILVGDGALRPNIEGEIFELGLTGKVFMPGVRDDVPELLQAADVFVLPSIYEGLPVVAVEAQASGIPTLLSDAIPKETQIVYGLVEFLPVDRGAEPWVNAIKVAESVSRRDAFEEILSAGFDIVSVAKWYEDFYKS